MGGAIGVGAAYPFDTLKTKAQTFEGKMAARVGSGAHGVGVGGPGGGGGEEAAAREDEKLLQSADEDEEEEVEERRETGTRCDVPGCTRVTWNGKSGTQCCRTCKASEGSSHGPVCDETNQSAISRDPMQGCSFYHATDLKAALAIQDSGFRLPTSSTGDLLGLGVYCSLTLHKAMQYVFFETST